MSLYCRIPSSRRSVQAVQDVINRRIVLTMSKQKIGFRRQTRDTCRSHARLDKSSWTSPLLLYVTRLAATKYVCTFIIISIYITLMVDMITHRKEQRENMFTNAVYLNNLIFLTKEFKVKMYIKTLSLIKRRIFFLTRTLLNTFLVHTLRTPCVGAWDIVEHFPLVFIAARGNVRP